MYVPLDFEAELTVSHGVKRGEMNSEVVGDDRAEIL